MQEPAQNTTAHFVGIGFCQPKFYKPHVWRKAKKIMEWLCDNTTHVIRFDHGRGKGKYTTQGDVEKLKFDDKLVLLADIYDKHHNIQKEEAA